MMWRLFEEVALIWRAPVKETRLCSKNVHMRFLIEGLFGLYSKIVGIISLSVFELISIGTGQRTCMLIEYCDE